MSFPRYERYKDSGVEWLGQVPEHWEVRRYKTVFRERDERSTDGSQMLLSVSAYTGVSPRHELIEADDVLVRADSLEGYRVCYPDDLVINIMLAWNRGLAFTKYEGIVSPAYCVFEVKGSDDPGFLNYLVRADETILYFKAFSSGVIDSRLRLYPDVFVRLLCCLPKLSEQRVIAAFLDQETAKIDALIEEQQRLIVLLKEKRQAVISHAVTKGLNPDTPMKDSGIEWLGKIPTHWKLGRISHLVSTRKGIAFQAEHFTNDGIAVVKASDVKNLTVRPSSTYLPQRFLEQYPRAILRTGEIILSTVGSTPDVKNSAVGQLGLLPEELSGSLLNQNTVVFIPSSRSLTNGFLFLVLQTTGYRDHLDLHAHGTANQASLNVSDMLDFPVPLPSPTEQEAIVTFIQEEDSKMQALTAEARRATDLLQERRSVLISAAVTGKIDVRNYSPRETPSHEEVYEPA